jgi:hypothetical protein
VAREGPKRSARSDEQGVRVGLWATVPDIGNDRIANLLSQWQRCLTTALPCNADAGLLPVDVTQTKSEDVARAKTHACEQEENRTVPRTDSA